MKERITLEDTVLNHAIDNRGAGLDNDAVLVKVKEQLEQFAVEAVTS